MTNRQGKHRSYGGPSYVIPRTDGVSASWKDETMKTLRNVRLTWEWSIVFGLAVCLVIASIALLKAQNVQQSTWTPAQIHDACASVPGVPIINDPAGHMYACPMNVPSVTS